MSKTQVAKVFVSCRWFRPDPANWNRGCGILDCVSRPDWCQLVDPWPSRFQSWISHLVRKAFGIWDNEIERPMAQLQACRNEQ